MYLYICVCPLLCEHDILQTTCGNFTKFTRLSAIGDIDELNTFWWSKVKGWDHTETNCGQINTSRGISCKPLVGILPNSQAKCNWGHRWTVYILMVKSQRMRSHRDQLWSNKHFKRHILQTTCGNFTKFTTCSWGHRWTLLNFEDQKIKDQGHQGYNNTKYGQESFVKNVLLWWRHTDLLSAVKDHLVGWCSLYISACMADLVYSLYILWRVLTPWLPCCHVAVLLCFAVFLFMSNQFLIKPKKDTRIHGNTSYEPLTTFLRRTMRSVQVSMNVKK